MRTWYGLRVLRILASRRALAIVAGAIAISAVFACSSILGLTDYHEVSDGGPAPTDAGGSCDVDLHKVCYPCTPTTNEQFLNSCSGADCVPFDDKRVTKLLADGGLPPAPPGGDGSI